MRPRMPVSSVSVTTSSGRRRFSASTRAIVSGVTSGASAGLGAQRHGRARPLGRLARRARSPSRAACGRARSASTGRSRSRAPRRRSRPGARCSSRGRSSRSCLERLVAARPGRAPSPPARRRTPPGPCRPRAARRAACAGSAPAARMMRDVTTSTSSASAASRCATPTPWPAPARSAAAAKTALQVSERESGPFGGPETVPRPSCDARAAAQARRLDAARRERLQQSGVLVAHERGVRPELAVREARAQLAEAQRADQQVGRLDERVPARRRLASRDHPGGFRAWAQIHPPPPRATLDYASPEACFGIQPGRNAGARSSGANSAPSTPRRSARDSSASAVEPLRRAQDQAAPVDEEQRRDRHETAAPRRAGRARARDGSGLAGPAPRAAPAPPRRRPAAPARRCRACAGGGCARRRAGPGASSSSRRGRSARAQSRRARRPRAGERRRRGRRARGPGKGPEERAGGCHFRPRRSRRRPRCGMMPAA